MSRKESPLRQLTIRGFGRDLERVLRDRARREGISLNKAVVRMLEEAAGLRPPSSGRGGDIGPALDALAGTWSAAETRSFKQAVADFEQLDPDLWS